MAPADFKVSNNLPIKYVHYPPDCSALLPYSSIATTIPTDLLKRSRPCLSRSR